MRSAPGRSAPNSPRPSAPPERRRTGVSDMRLSPPGCRRESEKGPAHRRTVPAVYPPITALGSLAERGGTPLPCVALSSGSARTSYRSSLLLTSPAGTPQSEKRHRAVAQLRRGGNAPLGPSEIIYTEDLTLPVKEIHLTQTLEMAMLSSSDGSLGNSTWRLGALSQVEML